MVWVCRLMLELLFLEDLSVLAPRDAVAAPDYEINVVELHDPGDAAFDPDGDDEPSVCEVAMESLLKQARAQASTAPRQYAIVKQERVLRLPASLVGEGPRAWLRDLTSSAELRK